MPVLMFEAAPCSCPLGPATSLHPAEDIDNPNRNATRYIIHLIYVRGEPDCQTIADLVQDLYLRELKAHKPTPIKASDAEGHVQRYSAPKPPRSPEEGDIANDLKAYEEQQVEIEGQAVAGEAGAAEEDWFEEEEETEAHAAH